MDNDINNKTIALIKTLFNVSPDRSIQFDAYKDSVGRIHLPASSSLSSALYTLSFPRDAPAPAPPKVGGVTRAL
jgi:hypothetical protein